MKRYDHVSLLKGFEKIGIKQELIAAELGVGQSSISRWAKKAAEPSIDNYFGIIDLARRYGIIGDEEKDGRPADPRANMIDEIDLFAGLGGGGLSIIESAAQNGITFHREAVRDQWRLPDSILNRFNAKAHHIKAFPSRGDSMLPTINDGDVVFVDTRHRVPSPPGIYALADEFGGVVVKRLEVVSRPQDDPVVVRVSSDNTKHRDRELTLDEIQIIGMYVGRFTM